MTDKAFVDYYEELQVSPNADSDTIERVFRHLAKRFHPDNQATGNTERFQRLVAANRALVDPEQRAAYDVRYMDAKAKERTLFEEAAAEGGYEDDRVLRERLLSLLYIQRRREVEAPSMGDVDLERLLSCPPEHLQFHVWYLKEKQLIQRTEQGFAITVLGIDTVDASRTHFPRERLLAERAESDARDERERIEARSSDRRRSP